MKQIKIIALTAAFVATVGLISASTLSFADPQDDASFTCASAVNVMDCIKQTGTGTVTEANATSVPINSQALGFTGPLSVGLRYDNYLAWIMDVGYSQEFYNSAAAFKLSAGLNERRANVTLGYSITPKQQIKLTYEYLSQNLPFDYASGTVNQWVNQNALGGSYRYVLDNGIVRALELYGDYTKANSKDLSDVEMYTDNVLTQINYRRIAGGTQIDTGGSVTLTPFKGTILKVGAGYSSLSFDTKWEDNDASAVLAYNAELSQLLTPKTLVSAGIGNTASGSTYTAKVSQILPWSLEGALIGQYTATTSDIPGSTTVTANLSYPAPKTYTNVFATGMGRLKDWIQQPVIYNTRVLAKAEEKVVAVQITTNPIPPASIAVGTDLNPAIQTKNYFNYNTETLDKINYLIYSVTQKGNAQNVFSASLLGLQITPVDNYNAVLSSAAPASNAAMSPGDYTVTLQAQGYRSGQVVSQINNPVDISIGSNNKLAAPTWVSNAQLPNTTAGDTSYNAYLTPLVKNNSGVPDETYTFTLSKNPSWLVLGGVNNQYLVLANNTSVPSNLNTTTVDLKATSSASGNSSSVQTFTINIKGTPSGPKWNNDQNNPSVVNLNYPQSADYKISVLDSQYVTTQGDNVTVSSSQITVNLPDSAIKPLDPADNTVTVSPPSVSDVNQNGTFTVTAKDANGTSTGYFKVSILPATQGTLIPPNWQQGVTLPIATAGVDYGSQHVYLDPYKDYGYGYGKYLTKTMLASSPTSPVPDSYSFTPNTSSSDRCKWIQVDPSSGLLSGTPDGVACKVYVNVASTAIGNSANPTQLAAQSLSGGVNPTWTSTDPVTLPSTSTVSVPYADSSGKNVNVNSSIYINTGTTATSAMQFKCTDCTAPVTGSTQALPITGLSLTTSGADAGLISGTPSDFSQVGVSIPFKLSATNTTTSLSTTTDQTFNITIQPNKNLPFSVSWDSTKPLPPGTSGMDYGNNSVYVKDYLVINAPSGDTIINYVLINNTCGGWLKLDAKSGLLSGLVPSQLNCTFNIQVTDQATANPVSPNTIQTFNAYAGPIWIKNDIAYTCSQGNNPQYYDDNSCQAIIDQSYLSSTIDEARITASSPPPIPTWLSAYGRDPADDNNLKITTITAQDSLINSVNANCSSTLTLNAKDSTGGTGSSKQFIQCLNPNPNLTQPILNQATVKNTATFGVDYSYNINPYKNNGDETNITKTKKDSTAVADILTFLPLADPSSGSSCTGWLSIEEDGTLHGKNSTGSAYCSFVVNFSSTATGKSSSFTMNFTTVGDAPSWDSTKLTSSTNGIVFTVTDSSQGVLLNNFISNLSSPTVSNSLGITLDSTTTNSGLWQIVQIAQQGGTNQFYLVRSKTNDATDVGTQASVGLIAYDAATTTDGVPATLKINVNPDPTLVVQWQPNISKMTLNVGDKDSSYPLDSSFFRTCTDASCSTVIAGDTYTTPDQQVIKFPGTGNSATVSNNIFTVPTSTLKNSDNGISDLTFTGIKSKANGAVTTLTLPQQLTLNPNLALNTLNGQLTYDALATPVSSGTSNNLNLSNALIYGNIPGITFEIVTQPANNFAISSTNDTPAVSKIVRNLNKGSDNRQHLDAGDIDKSPITLGIKASYTSNPTISSTGSVTATVLPNNSSYTFYPRWDLTLPLQTYTVPGTAMSLRIDHNYVKTCNQGATIYSCGDTIVDNDSMTFFAFTPGGYSGSYFVGVLEYGSTNPGGYANPNSWYAFPSKTQPGFTTTLNSNTLTIILTSSTDKAKQFGFTFSASSSVNPLPRFGVQSPDTFLTTK